MLLIGISGKARSGKNEVASFLNKVFIEKTGKELIALAFADKLKEIAKDLFKWDGSKELFDDQDLGRNLLINIGCKMREIRPSVWVDYIMNQIDKQTTDYAIGYSVSDVRFKNEAQIINNYKGSPFLVRVERPGKQLDLTNISETECDDGVVFDYVIRNDKEGLDNVLKETYKLYDKIKEKYPDLIIRAEDDYQKRIIGVLKYKNSTREDITNGKVSVRSIYFRENNDTGSTNFTN